MKFNPITPPFNFYVKMHANSVTLYRSNIFPKETSFLPIQRREKWKTDFLSQENI
jgi:hypothetical protein